MASIGVTLRQASGCGGAGAPCPICNAAAVATVPEMPEGFQADTLNKRFVPPSAAALLHSLFLLRLYPDRGFKGGLGCVCCHLSIVRHAGLRLSTWIGTVHRRPAGFGGRMVLAASAVSRRMDFAGV
jgi:hypothetical protein